MSDHGTLPGNSPQDAINRIAERLNKTVDALRSFDENMVASYLQRLGVHDPADANPAQVQQAIDNILDDLGLKDEVGIQVDPRRNTLASLGAAMRGVLPGFFGGGPTPEKIAQQEADKIMCRISRKRPQRSPEQVAAALICKADETHEHVYVTMVDEGLGLARLDSVPIWLDAFHLGDICKMHNVDGNLMTDETDIIAYSGNHSLYVGLTCVGPTLSSAENQALIYEAAQAVKRLGLEWDNEDTTFDIPVLVFNVPAGFVLTEVYNALADRQIVDNFQTY